MTLSRIPFSLPASRRIEVVAVEGKITTVSSISNYRIKFKRLFKSAAGQNQGVFVNFWPVW
jgi:hypothetical protein